MRTLLVGLAVLLAAGWAFAQSPIEVSLGETVAVPQLQYEFYCQDPHVYLQTVNSSSSFGSEVADDIPDDFVGMDILDVVFYVSEWGGYWVNPSGVYVNFYDAECPPGGTPATSVYFPWASLDLELIYDAPGSFTCYRCTGYLPGAEAITADMSIGFQVDNDWGQTTPYCGIVMTDDNTTFGDCEAYWDGAYWGVPRWTPMSSYFGIAFDVAYCLSDGAQGNPSLDFLTCISDCDETVYKFNITAGGAPVNDMEICIYDAETGDPVDIELCSVPLDWICGHNGGPNCSYYQTTEHTIPPTETYGPFDFLTAGGVHRILEVVWSFTYNGNVVASGTTYFTCNASGTEQKSWGAVKALYK